jgi:hypothetical protein
MSPNDVFDGVQVARTETAIAGERDWGEPKLCLAPASGDVYVCWLGSLV